MIDLQDCRRQIDKIDKQIVELFQRRMQVCEQVAQYKIHTGKPVLDPEREKSKLEFLESQANGEFNRLGVQEIFQQIMAISRKRQYQLLTENGIAHRTDYELVDALPMNGAKVVFQGVEGAYSYAAMREYFGGDEITSFHVKTWRDAMDAIVAEKADYAVLPIENSTAGTVADIYDLLAEYQLFIVGEQFLRIKHVLLGVPGASKSDVTKVYSHPQALAQCSPYLRQHPQWESFEAVNTAGSAKKVAEEGLVCQAAIASREAGRLFGLEVLDENICSNGENSTRFIIVGRKPVYEKGSHKVSICFELPHETGTLYNMLSHIIYNGLNMTKIESRPIPGKNWEYRFFVDFEGNLEEAAVVNAIRGIAQEANSCRILGNY